MFNIMSSLHKIDDEEIKHAFKKKNINYFYNLSFPRMARPLLKISFEAVEFQ